MPEAPKNRIEDIKRHLYDREDTTSARRTIGVLHPIAHKVSQAWESVRKNSTDESTPVSPKKHSSIFKKFFKISIVFFIGALLFGAYMYFSGGISVSNDNIDIVVLGTAFTKGGEELPLQVEIVNRNNASLELANLIIEYPRGATDEASDVVRLPRDSIGTIKAGQSVTRNIKVKLFGEEKAIRPVTIRLEYHPEGSNAIFTKESQYGVTISSAPLSLVVDAPDTATVDQLTTFKITAKLNTALPAERTMLEIAYPNGFVFDSAVPAPTIGNSMWDLSALTLTDPVVVTFKGRLTGQPDDQQVFHFYAGTTSQTVATKVNVIYNSLLKTLTLVRPFLEARVLVNGQDSESYVVGGGDTVNGEIIWTNNLSSKITDGQIIATLSGAALEQGSINPGDGFYDSANNQIVWDKNMVAELSSIEPGARGSAKFTFRANTASVIGANVKNPSITLDVSIRGRQSAFGSISSAVDSVAKKVIKLASEFQVTQSAVYQSGPLPPKVEQETRFVVTWTLSNSSNSITQATAKAVLPVYVKWVSKVSGNNENVSYNEATREVIWNIGPVKPNTGTTIKRTASFLIGLSPSLAQVGSVPQLIKDVSLSGQDSFTMAIVKASAPSLSTLLLNDPTFKNGNDRVIQ